MNIIFDQGVPAPLRRLLTGHQISTAYEKGWSQLKNGDLIRTIESEGFDVSVTTDQNLKYQQNMGGRKVSIVVLLSTSWPKIRSKSKEILLAINGITSGGYTEISI